MLFLLPLLLLFSLLLPATLCTPSPFNPDAPTAIHLFKLPADADLTHPSLNTSHLLALRQVSADAALPANPYLAQQKRQELLPLPDGKLTCTTSGYSPSLSNVLLNTAQLSSIGDSACCITTLPCTVLVHNGDAVANMCNYKGEKWCLQCEHLAWVSWSVALQCEAGSKAAGKVLWGDTIQAFVYKSIF